MFIAMFESKYDEVFYGMGLTVEEAFDNLCANSDGRRCDYEEDFARVEFYEAEPVQVRREVAVTLTVVR